MPVFRFIAVRYQPTANRANNDNSGQSLFRATNMFIRGRGGNQYAEVYGGSLDLGEDLIPSPLTGIITLSTATRNVVGTGTNFTAELHLGQRIFTPAGQLVVVSEIVDDELFIAHSLPTASGSTTGFRMHVLFEVDKKRGTMLTGNALEFDRGTIMAVGSGELRLNGQPLNDPLTASKQVQIAIYDETTGDYIVQELGFEGEPFGITAAAGTAPTSKTFADTDVNTGTEQITVTAHGYQTGQKVTVSQAGTLPAPLQPNTSYYIIRIDANTIKLAATLADAAVGTAINLSTTGTAGTNTITPVSKNMPAGDRSIRVAKASTKLGPPSFGNPGEKIKLPSPGLTAGQIINISFPAMDSDGDPSNPHDAWRIYASKFDGSTANATANADSGAWYYVRTVTAAELGGTGAANYGLEYLDAEIDGILRLITFDNDKPKKAEYIATVAGYPVLVSCIGKLGSDGEPTAPGPCIVPFKPSNLAAAPLVIDTGQRNDVPLSPPEQIIGCYAAAGRLYLMTANTLQIAVFTADQDFPVATRPFWKAGFKNPYAICFVNGRLYGFTSAGATRSVADGEEGSEEHAFAADVEELMKDWKAENVFAVHDPQNECVCYVNSGARQNVDGFWESEIVPFMLRSEEWGPRILFSSEDEDSIISGVATVNGRLEFLMGGRDGSGGVYTKTYRFDEVSGESVEWALAWQFADGGSEDRPKKLKSPRVIGKLTDATLGIFGAAAGENIDPSVFEAGNAGSKTGAVALTDSSEVEYRPRQDVALNGQMAYALQIEGTWPGTGERDRVDEATLDVIVRGGRK
jgi:hypothetical protein